MKIDDVYKTMTVISNSQETVAGRKPEERREAVPGPEAGIGAGTEVDLSKTSVEFSRAAESMEKDSMKRLEKINDIKARLEAGTYQIDAGKVADRILGDTLANITES